MNTESKCENCLYNTNDFVCNPHCGGCDGITKYVPKEIGFPVLRAIVQKAGKVKHKLQIVVSSFYPKKSDFEQALIEKGFKVLRIYTNE